MKRLICLILCFAIILSSSVFVSAKSGYSYVLMEAHTSSLLYSDNGTETLRPHHSAKLMVLYLLCKGIEEGNFSFDDKVKASQNAFSQKGASIWLSVGEEISIHELILAITVGNANDACVAIAEHVSKTESDFVALMNETAEDIGMVNTKYFDATGESYNGYTTAEDIALLSCKLLQFDFLQEYFKTYITYIRDGKTQLVNTNRLIRTYDYCTGIKSYFGDDCKNVLIASATKGDVEVVCVITGEEDKDLLYKTAKEKLSIGLSAYKLYKPKTNKIILSDVKVFGGAEPSVKTCLSPSQSCVIRKSKEDKIEFKMTYEDNLIAPINIGDTVGYVIYEIEGEPFYHLPILAAENVKKRTLLSSMSKIFKNIVAM